MIGSLRLIEQGLAQAQDDRFMISDAGRAALGPDARRRSEPGVKISAISAANARDVLARSPTEARSHSMLAANARLARRSSLFFNRRAEYDGKLRWRSRVG
jgi:histidine ammonia-lyase